MSSRAAWSERSDAGRAVTGSAASPSSADGALLAAPCRAAAQRRTEPCAWSNGSTLIAAGPRADLGGAPPHAERCLSCWRSAARASRTAPRAAALWLEPAAAGGGSIGECRRPAGAPDAGAALRPVDRSAAGCAADAAFGALVLRPAVDPCCRARSEALMDEAAATLEAELPSPSVRRHSGATVARRPGEPR